jgi:hypothetical protein
MRVALKHRPRALRSRLARDSFAVALAGALSSLRQFARGLDVGSSGSAAKTTASFASLMPASLSAASCA